MCQVKGTDAVFIDTHEWRPGLKEFSLNELEKLFIQNQGDEWTGRFTRPDTGESIFTVRDKLIHRYSFAVPTEKVLKRIAKLSPIVEVGAGTGYWADLLRQKGAQVVAFDLYQPWRNPKWHFATAYFPIARGGVERAMRMYGDRTLFLGWPPYDDTMASDAVELHRGEYVVHVGEDWGGCTGNEKFHELLTELYTQKAALKIPQWYGIHDYAFIWKRK